MLHVITDIISRPGGWEERIMKQRTVASWAPYSKQGEQIESKLYP
jgi:hypothetical protein